jgi:hypothetical protein
VVIVNVCVLLTVSGRVTLAVLLLESFTVNCGV